MIIQDIKFLKQVSDPVTIDEVGEIIKKLEKELSKHAHGIGLSAIQIGIPKRVSVIKESNGFTHLINAEVVEELDPFTFVGEGCLSMPGVYVNTKRYAQVTVSTDVIENGGFHKEKWCFYWDGSNIVPIAVQHEIDHTLGLLMVDKIAEEESPRVALKNVGRNAPCPCGKCKPDGSPIKYKNCCLR